MGQKPIILPNSHIGTNPVWANYLEPDSITVEISGVLKGSLWDSSYPEPPNGVWVNNWLSPGRWKVQSGYFYHNVNLITSNISFLVFHLVTPIWFYAFASPVDNLIMSNTLVDPNSVYYDGQVEIELPLDGYSLTKEWSAAELVQVPEYESSYGNKSVSVTDGRWFQYNAKRDRSRLNIITK